MSTNTKQDELRAKIEAAETRNAERSLRDKARETGQHAVSFVRKHPLATLAGVTVLGLTIGSMTRPGRRLGRKISREASGLAMHASELGMAYASGFLDSAGETLRNSSEKLEALSGDVAESARKAGIAARNQAEEHAATLRQRAKQGGGTLRKLSREAARQAGRAMRNVKH